MGTNNYTVGRGKAYFAQFAAGTQTPGGERYLGNSPGMSLNIKTVELDEYSSTNGVKEKTESTLIQVDRSGSLTVEDMAREILALLFLGTSEILVTASQPGVVETVNAVEQGLYYQVGLSLAPQGVRDIANLSVKVGATTMNAGADYTVDLALARLYVVPGGGIANENNLSLTFDVNASDRELVIAGTAQIEGALRFISDNQAGDDRDYYLPWVKLNPNGDLSLIADTWQQVTFDVQVIAKSGAAAVYADGRTLA